MGCGCLLLSLKVTNYPVIGLW